MEKPKFKIGQKVSHWNKEKRLDYFTVAGHELMEDFFTGEPYWMYRFKEYSNNFFLNEDQLQEVVNN